MNVLKKHLVGICLILSMIGGITLSGFNVAPKLNTIQVNKGKTVKDFFAYSPDRLPFVSAHRGGARKGFPENCLATFENTLSQVHAILEIDPHYTKDSAIVLMHDPTLNRTSIGQGKISDYTLKELQNLKLKDTEGNVTAYHMPTLDEALEWAKGKTILVLDMKDVPMEARVRKIEEHHAEASAIVMAYSNVDAQKCYQLNKNILMEVMLGTMDKVREFDKTGVPWQNVVVFVSHTLGKEREIFDEIHKRGAMCMIGSSRNYDIRYAKSEIKSDELTKGYLGIINDGADIIEADLAIEAGTAIKPLQQVRTSSKALYFH
ncbi:glycerophosphodiester phosphodiesterase family protein [Spirosoma sp.]|uniref:glycerophosphodiester phosphodiesterase family protein n=1 Tax=Spirosoma sp. TaxID=1899569 RepID=UPI003B3B4231